MSESFDVAVIGAGVFGAWTALHLQRAGCSVALVDQYGPGNARSSSSGQTRVIRMAYGVDAIYTRMAQRSLTQWREFFASIDQPRLFLATGVLWIAPEGDRRTEQSLATLRACGIAHEVLGARELAQRYPQIAPAAGSMAICEPQAGGLMAKRATQAVLERCLRDGARLRIAKTLPPTGDGRLQALATAAGGHIHADHYVFACGPWLARALPDVLGGRIFPSRQEVLFFGPPPGDERFALGALPIWLDSARQYYGFPDIDGRGFKLACDAHGEAVDPDTLDRTPTTARVAEARAFLGERFPALADAPLVGATVCQYENTSNGDFVIDRHPAFDNVWIAGGGSGHGFKHGPAVGEYVAARILHDGPVEPRFALAGKSDVQSRQVH